MKKTVLKKVVAAVLSLAMVVTGLYVVAPQAKEAKAADSATVVDVYTAEQFSELVGSSMDKEGKVFAGWFADAECTIPVKDGANTPLVTGAKYYAKFVDEGILSVKIQLADDVNGTKQMRVLSSVDSLDYKEVGFDVYFGNADVVEYKTIDVFKTIDATEGNVEYKYSNKVIDKASEYFISGTIKKINPEKLDTDFYIKPFWTTVDGTKVYGQGRMFSVNDGLNASAFNITVPGVENPGASSVNVTVGGKSATAEVVGYKDGNLFLNVAADKATLPSTNKVEYNGAAVMYEKLQSVADVDTSWYDANPDADTYYVSTVADLYGINAIVERDEFNFKNKTIVIVSDITVNEGNTYASGAWDGSAIDWSAGFTPAEETTVRKWTPIGHVSIGNGRINFHGTIDGNGNTISGLVATVDTKDAVGFVSQLNGTLKNLKIENSYFESNSTDGSNGVWVAAAAGRCADGTIDNVYIAEDVVVKSNVAQTAGIAGRIDGDITIANTWFAGTVLSNNSSGYGCVGGIAGGIATASEGERTSQTMKIADCLVTGKVVGGNWVTGGIIGGTQGPSLPTTIDMRNCLSNAEVTHKNSSEIGAIIGAIYGANITLKVRDVYATKDVTSWSGSSHAAEDLVGISRRKSNTVYGLPQLVTDAAAQVGNGAFENFAFDYWCEAHPEGVWVVTEAGMPQLKAWTSYADAEIMQKYTGTTAPAHKGWFDAQNYVNGVQQIPTGYEAGSPKDIANIAVYEIETGFDLYGFANQVDKETRFYGDTFVLTADIDLNPGWDATNPNTRSEAWKYSAPGVEGAGWGSDNFQGSVDGQGHTIRGVYMSESTVTNTGGLFGDGVENTGYIKNLKVENSYMENTAGTASLMQGVIAMRFAGTVENVYVAEDVILSAPGATEIGGLIGRMQNGYIKNCWFAGELYGRQLVGGMTGCIWTGQDASISDCVFTGTIHTTEGRNGAFVGQAYDNATIRNTFAKGKIYITEPEGADLSNPWLSGSDVAGFVVDGYTLTMDNTYSASDMKSLSVDRPLSGKVSTKDGGGAVVAGEILVPTADDLFGINAVSVFAGFDFYDAVNNATGVWVATANGPELKAFSTSTTQVQDLTAAQ
ncbi:MAG: hypothetical protein J6I97_02560 [Agathobacter sp.]|nr:hypothetical protein [Agathobacter sp.]